MACVTCPMTSFSLSGSDPAIVTWIACPPNPPKPNGLGNAVRNVAPGSVAPSNEPVDALVSRLLPAF